ncbi:hypothetical protein PT974_10034 [Cladobotryum mycophilum]|uniref:Uncharacterized protein n=1 Tax=Cladobotryum mycophilum TaxID=491253 RepID=A0ABR0S9U6_9HYPO
MASVDETQLKDHLDQHGDDTPWFLKSSYTVLLPYHEALTKSQSDFDKFLASELSRHGLASSETPKEDTTDTSTAITDDFTVVSVTTSGEINKDLAAMDIDAPEDTPKTDEAVEGPATTGPFIEGLLTHNDPAPPPDIDMENKMLTENADIANRSTKSPLVDLFFELEEVLSGPRMRELLDAAWADDPLATLKIIFNARSIHLGKSTKHPFYRAAGWLAQNHPLTLAANLRWLSRPIIEKKVKKEGEDDLVIVEAEKDEDDVTRFDVKYGVSHGYWKDLLNIIALAANKKLDVLSNPRDILNVENEDIKETAIARRNQRRNNQGISAARTRGGRIRGRGGRGGSRASRDPEHALEEKTVRIGNPKIAKRTERETRHNALVSAFESNAVYRALHLTVARLFAEQLRTDLDALRSLDPKEKKNVSLCGKWAPSHKHFHDRHTLIVSSIAEIMYPRDSLDNVLSPTEGRDTYLRYAREEYRKDVSALRKHLEIVERDITNSDFNKIKYDRLPSVAMKNYTKLFIKKDMDNFERYITRVAEGKANISGATLLPSTLVDRVRELGSVSLSKERMASMTPEQLIAHKIKSLESKTADGQWGTIVQRIGDSGTLSSSIAVCDVSGSMSTPVFKDGTCPMDSAIGLSLEDPEVIKVDLNQTFTEKVLQIVRSPWGGTTDFVAAFEKLILPMAIKNNVKQEDMVKRVFVFSDMQFNSAENCSWSDEKTDMWAPSYERVKAAFEKAGYQMPELVFWNLAGGRAGYETTIESSGDPTAPKPVTAEEVGTSLVSGYSQGMLKVFLDNGGFDEEDEEEGEEDNSNEKGVAEGSTKTKAKKDPLATVKKAISHKAYDVLKVVD